MSLVAVHGLCEVACLYGFTRFEPAPLEDASGRWNEACCHGSAPGLSRIMSRLAGVLSRIGGPPIPGPG
jgi:hypothetical protein